MCACVWPCTIHYYQAYGTAFQSLLSFLSLPAARGFRVSKAATAMALASEVEVEEEKGKADPLPLNHRSSSNNKNNNSFEGLGVCEHLCEACTALGWSNPTPIQMEALPLALQGAALLSSFV